VLREPALPALVEPATRRKSGEGHEASSQAATLQDRQQTRELFDACPGAASRPSLDVARGGAPITEQQGQEQAQAQDGCTSVPAPTTEPRVVVGDDTHHDPTVCCPL